MKKLKKFVLNSNLTILTNHEQLNVVGGNANTNTCSSKSYDQCGDTCYAFGYQGKCLWVKKDSRCACSVTYVG